MTIRSVRIYYWPEDKELEGRLTRDHWGFAEWFERRLKPIREQLRGPEAKGVDIVNFMLYDNPSHARNLDTWARIDNTFEYNAIYDLKRLPEHTRLENIQTLMRYTAGIACLAPWPQVKAVGHVLVQPLTDQECESLLPYLQWPRGNLTSGSSRRARLRRARG